MKKNRINLLIWAAILLVSSTKLLSQSTIYSNEYGLSESGDASPVVLNMINDAKEKGISKIVIEQGVYHFYPDKAFQKFCNISNHDNGLRSTPFPILGFDGLEIVANGSQFIFHGLMLPFIIEDSKNISLSGFSIDWDLPLASEALVVETYPDKKCFDLKISPDQPYEIRNGELIFLKEGYEHNIDRAIYWDPETSAIAYKTQFYAPISTRDKPSIHYNLGKIQYIYEQYPRSPENSYRGMTNSIIASDIEPGIVRISFEKGNAPKKGLVLVCKGLNGYNRLAPAIRIAAAEDILLNKVSIYSAGGMGIIAEGSKNIKLDSVLVIPSPGKGRMLSTSADATHFVNCKGKVEMVNCTFSNQLDDATNVHGFYMQVVDWLDSTKIGVRIGHFQQKGCEFGLPGDNIGFVDINKSLNPVFNSCLKTLEKINDSYYILEFEDVLSLDKNEKYLVENCSAYPEVLISNCRILNNRGRGLLISTPEKTIIENNFFSTQMSAIYITSDISFWHESGAVKDLIIRNNNFGDCCYGGGKRPVILIDSDSKGSDFIFKNIIIENNKFNSFDAALLSATRVKNLIFRKNEISNSENYIPIYPDSPVFSITESKDVLMEKNLMETGFENILFVDADSKKGLVVRKNHGF